MFADTHPAQGHPVQRRVSYRRLTEEDCADGSKSGGGESLLSVRQADGRSFSSKAGSTRVSTGVDARGGSHGDDTDADTAWINNPVSIWHEIWLAVRCVVHVMKGRHGEPVLNGILSLSSKPPASSVVLLFLLTKSI